MTIVRKVAKNTSIILIGNVFNKIISLFVIIYLARYLDAEGYGIYSFVLAYLSFFGIIADLGITTILVREIARDSSIAEKYVGNVNAMKLFLSILAILLSIIIIKQLDYPEHIVFYITIFALTLLFGSLSGTYFGIFQAHLKIEYSVISDILDKMLLAAVAFWIIFSRGTLMQIIIGMTIAKFISMLISYLFSKKFVLSKFDVDFNVWKYFLKQSWPIALTSSFIMIYMRIDQVMLSKMIGNEAVGYYSAAVNLVGTLSIIPIAFMTSIYPLLSKYYKTQTEQYTKIYALSFRFMNIISIPLAFGTTLLAEPIIRFFYKELFLTATPALQVLVWSEIFVFLGVVNNNLLISSNKQRLDFVFTSSSAFINVILNLILIPKYSFVGAGIATIISTATGPIIGLFISTTHAYSKSMFESMLKPIMGASGMTIVIYSFISLPHLSIPIGVLAYFGLMYLIKGITKEDIYLVKSLLYR